MCHNLESFRNPCLNGSAIWNGMARDWGHQPGMVTIQQKVSKLSERFVRWFDVTAQKERIQ